MDEAKSFREQYAKRWRIVFRRLADARSEVDGHPEFAWVTPEGASVRSYCARLENICLNLVEEDYRAAFDETRMWRCYPQDVMPLSLRPSWILVQYYKALAERNGENPVWAAVVERKKVELVRCMKFANGPKEFSTESSFPSRGPAFVCVLEEYKKKKMPMEERSYIAKKMLEALGNDRDDQSYVKLCAIQWAAKPKTCKYLLAIPATKNYS